MGISDQFKDKAEQAQKQAKDKLGQSKDKGQKGQQGDAKERGRKGMDKAKERGQDTVNDVDDRLT
ncbi:hypothetical protein [Streptomyces zagrosensis]|uniref:Uncharacterized protein n=1 Tax=Streptomyces zagrosensis TaxID=1042984 RepID=A0A7W9V0P8_9ACTN|nr:hypothetical protein [Streptomyces zagrosensis]MBB5938340.1 hypothetical protein [Streptomyces zagrosensis]